MQQQINLLNAFTPPEKPVLPASMMLRLLCLVIVVLTGLQVQAIFEKNVLDKRFALLSVTQEIRAGELATLSGQLPESDATENIQKEVSKLTEDIDKKAGLLKIAERANKTFSDYMQALAIRTLPGVWLKQISIDQKSGDITLLGRTLNSDLVPLFLAELGKESVFSNIEFKQLKLAKPASDKLNMAFALRTTPNFEDVYIFPEDAEQESAKDGESGDKKKGTVSDNLINTLLKTVVTSGGSGGSGGKTDLPAALGNIFNKANDE